MSVNSKNSRRPGWFSRLALAFRREWNTVFGDVGVLLFFVALPLLYPVVYTLIYNPEIVTDMPLAVVDNSRTPSSRRFVQTAEASPSVRIYDYCTDMAEAKSLFAENKVFGILEIPADYEKQIMRGENTTVNFYAEMSLLLRYRAFLTAMTDVQLKLTKDIAATRIAAVGLSGAGMAGMPVEENGTFLGDPGQGFASFVIPGIVILIIQQSMVLGICFICGTSRERRRPLAGNLGASATVLGKALCYTVFYIPLTIYVVHYIPIMFGLPHTGAPADYLLFLLPLLLATAMFGQVVQVLCKERESGFMVVVFSSVLFLFLSGLTWPRYAMSELWRWVGNLVPATWGVEGFIRINNNGATLAETTTPYLALWVLTAVYFVCAIAVTAWIDRRTAAKTQAASAG